MVDFALLRINLSIKLEVDLVRLLESLGVAFEGQALGLEVKLEVGRGDIGDGDGEVDEVLGGIRGVGALGPEN